MTILDAYTKATPGSAKLAEEAMHVLPDGVSTDTRKFSPHGIYVERGLGSRKWDVDGNELLDFFGGHGALMLGHAHPTVTQAAQNALANGIQFAASSPREVEWAALVQQYVPTADKVRFTASGTEATLLALRMARAYTGKPKILRVTTHYHGWHDFAVSGYSAQFDGEPAPGVLAEIAANTILVRRNDEDAVRNAIRAHAHELSAVILEPLGSHCGIVPTTDSFIKVAAQEAKAQGVVVILDEVITGFRLALGGYQELMGLTPDLTTMGKAACGGLPGGLVCGSEELMSTLSANENVRKGAGGKVFHQGTFTGNPVTATSAIETIKILAGSDGCAHASETAEFIRSGAEALFEKMNVPWRCYGCFSSFHFLPDAPSRDIATDSISDEVFQKRPADKLQTLRMAMILEGADLSSRGSGFASAVHTRQDSEEFLVKLEAAMARMVKEGAA